LFSNRVTKNSPIIRPVASEVTARKPYNYLNLAIIKIFGKEYIFET
jgi:hypothetical protein